MKRLIFYDLDGTLVDTLQDITEAANHMLREIGLPPRDKKEIRQYIGRGAHELVRLCVKADDQAAIAKGLDIYRAYYQEHLVTHSRLYPNALETLEHFKDRPQAVISNKPNPHSRDILRALGVAQYFCAIIGGNSGFPIKPNPQSLISILMQERVAPSEAVFVGDSPIDIDAGRQAGTMTVMLTHGFTDEPELRRAEPDVLVENFGELLELARQEHW